MASKAQVTLALLKPDIATNPFSARAIINQILSKELSVVKKKTVYWTREDAEKFYAQHKGKFFYRRLVEYTTCGPIEAMILAGRNAVQTWRDMIGPTKTFQAKITHPSTIRGAKGLTDTRNSAHGSDSPKSAIEEIQKVFPEWNSIGEKPSSEPAPSYWDEERINNTLGQRETWSAVYRRDSSDTAMEWFVPYTDIRDYIISSYRTATEFLKPEVNAMILDVGCGNSAVGPETARELGSGVNVYCVDFSIEALSSSQTKMNDGQEFDETTNCHFVLGDLTRPLCFEERSVSVIVDKGGTDSILKQPDGTRLHQDAVANLLSLLHDGGVYLHISDQGPEVHLDTLQAATRVKDRDGSFSISCKKLETANSGSCAEYFLYSLTRG